jgi:diguanylate cyclase (GGDEF)-like protein
LSLQLAITASIGLLALGSLYWASQVVIENNLSQWASRWSTQLNELGAPFYLSSQRAALTDVERFVATYPEVSHVNWYEPDGTLIFSVVQDENSEPDSENLPLSVLRELRSKAGSDSPHILQDSPKGPQRFDLLGSIWTESFIGDGLLDFRPGDDTETTIDVVGFVSVELDYSWYHQQLLSNLWLGSIILVAVLCLSWAVGRRMLRNSLQPLLRLQEPLAELAKGRMNVQFAPSRYGEIQNIIDTLDETTTALEQRDRHLVHLATHDSLTGLFNRHGFVEALSGELGRLSVSASFSALFFMDLDQFKYINDTCGHPAGDELLKRAAERLREVTRPEDVVARFGGDEFAILARDVTRKQARELGSRMLEQMRVVRHVQDNKVFHLQCSVGVAMLRSDQCDAHEYLAQADIACHAAKSKGRNRIEFYKLSDNEDQHMAKEMRWVQTVRRALENDSFVMKYQPIVSVKTGVACHYEVLLRLETENGELIPPDVFLSAAGRFGLVVDIDRWVVTHALDALAEYRLRYPNLGFSINLSASILEDADFAQFVRRRLDSTGIPGDAVIFEITEQVAIRFADRVDRQLSLLRKLGCQFAIDDFGKGYSSFSYLKELPVDYLKIDGAFIEYLDKDVIDQTMVKMIAEIARAAGIKTVAEYVQSAATLELLAQYGIDYAQGYYLGRPASAPAIHHYGLKEQKRRLAG